jgi:hypothetical protein
MSRPSGKLGDSDAAGLANFLRITSGKCHIRNHLPQYRRQYEGAFDFRPTSWQPPRKCLLTAQRITGTIQPFPPVCCVLIPLSGSARGHI